MGIRALYNVGGSIHLLDDDKLMEEHITGAAMLPPETIR